ncbi:hypothetical protein Hanom_Chr03g00251391 [Helianthus anomalus]
MYPRRPNIMLQVPGQPSRKVCHPCKITLIAAITITDIRLSEVILDLFSVY